LGRQSIRDLDFEAVEMAARRQALRLAARALEQRLNADTSDHAGPELPCSCAGPAQYHGRHQKTFESVLGPLHLERAYYHCAKCQSGFCPRDGALGLNLFSLTPGVLRMTGSTAALVSFEESSALLHELAGVEVMRPSEVVGHAGKQPDGCAKTREAKAVTGWPAESRDQAGKPVRDPGTMSSSA